MPLLTIDTVPEYVMKNIDKIPLFAGKGTERVLKATEIEGGNLNYAFCVRDEQDGQAVFVKQAPDFIKVFGPDAKLHRERLQCEVELYREWTAALGEDVAAQYLPTIFSADFENMIFIMEFLESYQLLDKKLYSETCEAGLLMNSQKLGELLGLVHAKTHCTIIGEERAQAFTKSFENRALRDIQLAYVFTKAFEEPDRSAWLRDDAAFMAELEQVRALYNGSNKGDLALLHGDFHPGSVMVKDDGEMRAIDPEFCIYGPPGLDLGSLLSGYVLAYVLHASVGRNTCLPALRACIDKIWASYTQKASDCGLPSDLLSCIGEDAVAFAACEVARTALGFAGVRGLPIEDATAKTKAEDKALVLAHKCIMGRKGKGVAILLEELDRFMSGIEA